MPLKKLLPILTMTLFLGGCITAGSKPSSSSSPQERTPALKRYSIDFQTRLAGDFGKLPAGSAGRQALKDYGQLRRAVCVLDDWRQQACRDIQAAEPAGAAQ